MESVMRRLILAIALIVATTVVSEPVLCSDEAPNATAPVRQDQSAPILVDASSPTADLVRALQHSTLKYQRRYAAQIIGERKEPGTARYLIQALEDPEDVVQKAAAESLVNMNDRSLFPQLVDNLSSPNCSVRQYSAYVLGQLATKEDHAVVEALEKRAGDEKSAVRIEIIYALYSIGSASSKGTFVRGLLDEEPRIRSYCANALGNLKIADAGAVLSAALDNEMDESVRRSIVSAIGKVGGSASARTLAEAVTNETPSLRADIADALGEIKTPEATRALVELLSDGNVNVRARAASALANARDSSAAGPLAEALKDRSVLVRRPASEALIYVGDSSVIEQLVEALGDPDPEVAANAARALIQVNDLNAVHALINALDRENQKSRAVMVLTEITHRPYGADVAKWVQWYEENFKTGK
jgi:HEAT repeat protein